ncbi:uncharacterized protein [Eschrichtius robustus]|uniref:uncharacterized protein isoform X2 n=1 Tax=Eschrichtius robustus TaxID=9764 RepID=UPI0035BF404C
MEQKAKGTVLQFFNISLTTMNGTMTWWLARGKRLSVHPHMDHLSPAAGQNLLRTTGGYSVKDRLHVVSMAPGNCRISWSSNNMISQKERKPSLLQQPYPSLRRIRIGLVEEDVHEDMLCALLLPTNTTAAELFKSLNDYISGKLNWSFSVGICTDRVAAMTGRLSGFTTWVKEVASECESTHCVIHREMLAN